MTISRTLSSKCHKTKEKKWYIYFPVSPLAFRSWHVRRIIQLLFLISPFSAKQAPGWSEHGSCTRRSCQYSPSLQQLLHFAEEGPLSTHLPNYTPTISWNLVGLCMSPVNKAPWKRAKTGCGRWSYISCPSLESRFVMQNTESKMRPMDTRKQSEPNWLNKTQVSAHQTEY